MSQGSGRLWSGNREQILWFAFAYLLLALPCMGFLPNFWSRVLTLAWDSHTHQYITEQAILNVTCETLMGLDKHQLSCVEEQAGLGRAFWRAVGEVGKSNAAMDFLSSTRSDPVYHFDSERVDSAIVMLRQFWAQALLSIQAKEYQSARQSLGKLFHSLQDFYSHSNWVEMGHRTIYHHLLQPDEPAFPVAKDDTPTCLECFSSTCRDNILPRFTWRKHPSLLLTTGYFSTHPPKPEGKCSHGGIMDSSRHKGAKGGINKDTTSPLFSPHHYLHVEAAGLATEATLAVLRDLRDTVGHISFLRLFSVKQPPALIFVMDTTGSMFEEITAARLRALSIIKSRANTPGQPGTFLFVPFHDPEVGPVYETDDPNQFMGYMENVMALGGGDEPEMCLSGIQLALTHSPPLSEIFVFTDASPKDAHLFNAVKALTLERQCKVTFLLTEDPGYVIKGRMRRRRSREQLSHDRFSLYSSLSSLSGGLTVFTTNSDIYRVSTIVEDNTAADRVTLLHVESDSDSTSSHPFMVDSAVRTVTLHLTGNVTDCKLIDPSGHRQSLLGEQGPLAELELFEGLYRVRLLSPIQPGQWTLQAQTDGHFTFNIIGDSNMDFLYYFATVANETHPGLERVQGSPIAGVPTFLVVAVMGLVPSEEISFSHVTLLGANGESLLQVQLNSSSSASSSLFSHTGEELVGQVDSVPRKPFCVRLSGRDKRGNKLERVSTEIIQPTHIQIQVLSIPHLVPGHSTMVHFDVLNHGPARLFNLTANDNCGYLHQRGPHSFPVAERGSLRGQVDLHTPARAEAGATVTLTFTVRALDSQDSNYVVAYLTVVPPDPDTSPPLCSPMPVDGPCATKCTGSSWSVSMALTDRGRSGLASLMLHHGEGVLTPLHNPTPSQESPLGETHTGHDQLQADRDRATTLVSPGHHKFRLKKGDPPLNVSEWIGGSSQPLWVTYTSSCCSAWAELLVWDKAGNMKRCRLMYGQQKALRDSGTESNRTENTLLSSGFVVLLGLIWTILL
ncbi:von Willebrand factor A domain-containing protein 7 [Lampris incognitus]|uniref:von Willebrand factor A domain-containing protein 7 n=1 Tax=Lampris incognitus TaxID=2546036 RepID=UPI0024B48891|nr:von Willebrand factor A domain-containing protein 7 [Lampris incognitus]